ncbi:ArsR/SmtB family transcription factor [Amycolatopsis magusensis]|uniref:DNA-binding transcriptional ArsR family regulator n=1 Tax=Amycolatopsis magusensis TaxID=882444 RepID=A0ABS4PUW0_9PSEU|nr:helix-turn-helix domain-containing protein [Amycolatopsis magusensis]MBP2183220.1 DNA-binding transcriptional ArsR family regulator [Amycolatopsis magusensis]
MAELPPRTRVRDVELLKALAHPLRSALLNYLMAVGPRTASECAVAVDSSASNCSWHLRQLAEFGLVERAESGDGRERPWRVKHVGLDFGELADEPSARSAQLAVFGTRLREEEELTQRYLDTAERSEPEWLDASSINFYGLRVTAAELADLVTAVDALIRPYVGTIRQDAPADARPVHVSLRAFRRIEADGQPSA